MVWYLKLLCHLPIKVYLLYQEHLATVGHIHSNLLFKEVLFLICSVLVGVEFCHCSVLLFLILVCFYDLLLLSWYTVVKAEDSFTVFSQALLIIHQHKILNWLIIFSFVAESSIKLHVLRNILTLTPKFLFYFNEWTKVY